MKTNSFPIKTALLICLSLVFFSSSLIADKAFLGVYLENLTARERELSGIPYGVRVEMVIENSPAQRSGIRADDIILQINDMPIAYEDEVRIIINSSSVNDKLKIEMLSKGKRRNLELKLGSRPTDNPVNFPHIRIRTKHIGVKLQNLTPQLQDFFSVDHGILVAEVIVGSSAEKAGLKAGDVIIEADGRLIDSTRNFRNALKEKEYGDELILRYKRIGTYNETIVVIEEADSMLGFDLNSEIILMGRELDIEVEEINRWFKQLMPDSSRIDLEKQLETLQSELDKIRQQLLSR